MQCPSCKAKTDVLRTPAGKSDLPRVVRKRQCRGPAHHRFESVELARALTLEHLAIRSSGNGQLRTFDKGKLLAEVRLGVNGALSEAEIQIIVNGVTARLEALLPDITQWASVDVVQPGRRLTPEPHAYIDDYTLRDIVEDQLKQAHNRIAHFLYAIAIRGRRDRAGRTGWTKGASDVLEWVYGEYPDLAAPPPTPPGTAPAEIKWLPVEPRTEPSYVLKSGRIIVADRVGDDDALELQKQSGRLVEFQASRFQQGIHTALLGHPNAAQWSVWISWWVLHGLRGQYRVTSSQLSAGVLECLRHLDDLAYLRWAARMKAIPQVRGLKDEAIALITYPSDRLKFIQPGLTPQRPVPARS